MKHTDMLLGHVNSSRADISVFLVRMQEFCYVFYRLKSLVAQLEYGDENKNSERVFLYLALLCQEKKKNTNMVYYILGIT